MAKDMGRLLLEKPQINLGRSSMAKMWLVNLCAFMVIIQSSLTDSFSSLVIAISAVLAAILTEFLFYQDNRFLRIKDGSSIATALILTLFLPNRILPIYAAMGTVFAIAVIKHGFGGIGSNWLNPAAGGWVFVRCAWPGVWNRALEGSAFSLLEESFSGKLSDIPNTGNFGGLQTFLNDTIFSFTGSELPEGYAELFASAHPGIIADRGILALLAGTIIISASQVNRSWIPAVWLGIYALLVRLSGFFPVGDQWGGGDLLFILFSGGSLAAAFILNADPATSAKSNWGILAAAVLSVVLAWFFRFRCGESYGAVFAVAAVNSLLPAVRAYERKLFYDKPPAPKHGPPVASLAVSVPGVAVPNKVQGVT